MLPRQMEDENQTHAIFIWVSGTFAFQVCVFNTVFWQLHKKHSLFFVSKAISQTHLTRGNQDLGNQCHSCQMVQAHVLILNLKSRSNIPFFNHILLSLCSHSIMDALFMENIYAIVLLYLFELLFDYVSFLCQIIHSYLCKAALCLILILRHYSNVQNET